MEVEPKQNQLQTLGPAATCNVTIWSAAASTNCDGMGLPCSPDGMCVHSHAHMCISRYVHAVFTYMRVL